MSAAPEISVVIAFHNNEAHIRRCIEGLMAQSIPNDHYEIIMVDNNSTDGSRRIVERCPRVKLLTHNRPGAYAARNHGIAKARGQIIAFTDADCVPVPTWLEALGNAMDQPEVAIVQGDRYFETKSHVVQMVAAYEAEKNAFIFASEIPDHYHAFANNMAARKCLFDHLGPFVEMRRGADVVFVQRVIQKYSCRAVLYCPEARVLHLEITGLRPWFRKMFIYGKSYENYKKVEPCRPLNYSERLRIMSGVLHKQRHPFWAAAALVPALIPGVACYEAGRINGAWKKNGSSSPS